MSSFPALGSLRSLLTAWILVSATAAAAPIVVTTLVDENDGSPNPALGAGTSLREAIHHANSQPGADVITFTPGLTGIIGLTSPLPDLTTDLEINGPGSAILAVQRYGQTPLRIFTIRGASTVVALRGLSIRRGLVNGSFPASDQAGGGIFANNLELLVEDCVIANNQVSGGGGGGGIYTAARKFRLIRSSVVSNSCAGSGAGIFNNATETTEPFRHVIQESTISGNIVNGSGFGAGIANQSLLTLSDSTIALNQTGSGHGGGLYSNAQVRVVRCLFQQNRAVEGGGMLSAWPKTVDPLTQAELLTEVHNCTFHANTATTRGGAIATDGGIEIDSCTVSTNAAPSGQGGGIFSHRGPAATHVTRLRNTIVSANLTPTSSPGTDVDHGGSGGKPFVSLDYNLIGNGNATAQFSQAHDLSGVSNPQLMPLADNGGPTSTRRPGPTSPAVNAGNTNLLTDQRGYQRKQGLGDEIGAYEITVPPTGPNYVVTVLEGGNDGDHSLQDLSLHEAILYANSNPTLSEITFAPSLMGTIQLTEPLPNLTTKVTIKGPGANVLEVRGQQGPLGFPAIVVASGVMVTIEGLAITHSAGLTNQGDLRMKDCAIEDHLAQFGGGILSTGPLSLENCSITGNTATFGGGLDFNGSTANTTATLKNCTLSGNEATGITGSPGVGGAILNRRGKLVLEHCTITANTAASGAGIADSNNNTTTTLRSTIVSGNIGSDLDRGSVNRFVSLGHNLIGDGNAGATFTTSGDLVGVLDPLLGPLGLHGGTTPTHRIQLASPARDAAGPTTLSTDQRGLSRTHGPAADIGAYELQPESYAYFQQYTFPIGQGAIGDDEDQDGISNGIEWLTGTDPLTPQASNEVLAIEISQGQLEIAFDRSVLVDPNQSGLQISEDLINWALAASQDYQVISQTSPLVERVKISLPLAGYPKRFVRLFAQ